MISKAYQIITVHIQHQRTFVTKHHMRNINAKKSTEF